jgi:hypothetical protein
MLVSTVLQVCNAGWFTTSSCCIHVYIKLDEYSEAVASLGDMYKHANMICRQGKVSKYNDDDIDMCNSSAQSTATDIESFSIQISIEAHLFVDHLASGSHKYTF